MSEPTDRDVDTAVLASIESQLDELTTRVTALADRYGAIKGSAVSEELYATERSLTSARRALNRARSTLEDRD